VEVFNAATTWPQILGEAGWRCVRGDGHAEGSGWSHPAATSVCSATITGDRLYVYSTNTVFTPTEPGAPRGYSRFDAWAQLHHAGDIRAALRHLRTGGVLA
jgi:hypothetical protein